MISPWGISPRGGLHPDRVLFNFRLIFGFDIYFLTASDLLCWSWIIRFPNLRPVLPVVAWRLSRLLLFKASLEFFRLFLDGSHRSSALRSAGFEALYISSCCSTVPPSHNCFFRRSPTMANRSEKDLNLLRQSLQGCGRALTGFCFVVVVVVFLFFFFLLPSFFFFFFFLFFLFFFVPLHSR